ncbi:hypothetical protein LIER_31921 [Lithospermum erythrorhizon]|uniref:F-box domain-containing protein n=1 Tax=Lithospermum erythrorhizon TaxID=34254 RepID=A0AAV3RSI8_LITER
MRNKKVERSTNEATSAEKVASIDDILTQILLLLPIKSLVRFISVSKHWLKLIKNPQFSFNRNPNPNPALGLFLQRTAYKKRPTFEYMAFGMERSTLYVIRQQRTLSDFQSRCIRGLSLVFDPSRSPEYKVISVWSDIKYQIEIYSSLIKTWRKSGNAFVSNVDFDSGTYWNGSMHWINHNEEGFNHLCYNIDKEYMSTISTPPEWDESMDVYLGESCDHLHLVQTAVPSGIKFNVYELKRDCSEWFVKYQLHLGLLFNAYPWKMRCKYFDSYVYFVRSFVRGQREEDSFLVMETPGKIVRLNLAFHTFEEIWDFEDDEDLKCLPSSWTKSFEYIESLCFV